MKYTLFITFIIILSLIILFLLAFIFYKSMNSEINTAKPIKINKNKLWENYVMKDDSYKPLHYSRRGDQPWIGLWWHAFNQNFLKEPTGALNFGRYFNIKEIHIIYESNDNQPKEHHFREVFNYRNFLKNVKEKNNFYKGNQKVLLFQNRTNVEEYNQLASANKKLIKVPNEDTVEILKKYNMYDENGEEGVKNTEKKFINKVEIDSEDQNIIPYIGKLSNDLVGMRIHRVAVMIGGKALQGSHWIGYVKHGEKWWNLNSCNGGSPPKEVSSEYIETQEIAYEFYSTESNVSRLPDARANQTGQLCWLYSFLSIIFCLDIELKISSSDDYTGNSLSDYSQTAKQYIQTQLKKLDDDWKQSAFGIAGGLSTAQHDPIEVFNWIIMNNKLEQIGLFDKNIFNSIFCLNEAFVKINNDISSYIQCLDKQCKTTSAEKTYYGNLMNKIQYASDSFRKNIY